MKKLPLYMPSTITARYPSNIALVKYWGKHGNQLPCNPSISLTLHHAVTEVKLELTEQHNDRLAFEYFFEGKKNAAFGKRILKFAQQQTIFSKLFERFAIRMASTNSFPHSAGIASSASAFAAVTAALLKTTEKEYSEMEFAQKASTLARLGSGSACRSFYGPYALWGKLPGIKNSHNEYAIPITAVHKVFQNMRDDILIVETAPKKVSSSVGHSLMEDHPFAKSRFQQGTNHARQLLAVLKNGDFNEFIRITETEALTLQAMMMTSRDYYLLMKPKTVAVIEAIWKYREDTKLPICFSLDAGANVHLIYPEDIENQVETFVEHFLQEKLINSVIKDKSSSGGKVF